MHTTHIPAHGWGFIALVTFLMPPVGVVAVVCKFIRNRKGASQ